jgi:probable rRNA maturation factor
VRQSDLAKPDRWPVSFLRRVVNNTLQAHCQGPAEVSLTLTTDPRMHQLNSQYRGIDKPTDVLAFALEEGEQFHLPAGMPRQLGDVVVSLDTTRRQAAESGNSFESELAWVICHGTLHLLGFDHQNPQELSAMRDAERRVLAALNVDRNWPELWPEENNALESA